MQSEIKGDSTFMTQKEELIMPAVAASLVEVGAPKMMS
jgi:hypothetical protein